MFKDLFSYMFFYNDNLLYTINHPWLIIPQASYSFFVFRNTDHTALSVILDCLGLFIINILIIMGVCREYIKFCSQKLPAIFLLLRKLILPI